MRAIITGGSGLIGRALADSLCADGWETVILSRSPEKVTNLPAGAHAERWDGQSAAGWAELADGADAIINLAGENLTAGRWTTQRKALIRQSRVNAGRAVVEAAQAARRKPGVVVQASGVGHYGIDGDTIMTEQSPAGSDFGAQVTLDWEAATAPLDAIGIRRVIVRMGPALTMKGRVLPPMVLQSRLCVGGPLGSGRQWFSWIHLADTVGGIRFLMSQSGARGAFNLCAPNPLTNAEFSRVLGRVMNRPSWFPVPALAMRLLYGEMSTVLLDGQRVMPARLLEMGYSFRFPDAESALRDLLR